MRVWIIVAVFSVSVHGLGFSEPKDFYAKETQSVQVRLGDTSEGVLLMKHYKFGTPVYLVSTFVESQVKKTKMLSQGNFFSLYGQVYEALLKRPADEDDKGQKCDRKIDVTLKEKGSVTRSLAYCMDGLDNETKAKFSNWFVHIKERL